MKLRDYIIRRLILLVPVLIGVSVITFALTRLVGNPAAVYIDERCSQSNACIAAVMERYGFNQPVPVQYLRYMWAVLHGDLGVSRTAAWLPVRRS